ncbi:hypothetical protein RRG08_064007 [Elysia crispata]|uniref:Uncharacterized protein n=1 Tax=Elysia crispata TaxID=231223 RepID=A0AAE0YEU4_9GAST|nr:hypothetical protein RRG08_064007 [Elysia crispata]
MLATEGLVLRQEGTIKQITQWTSKRKKSPICHFNHQPSYVFICLACGIPVIVNIFPVRPLRNQHEEFMSTWSREYSTIDWWAWRQCSATTPSPGTSIFTVFLRVQGSERKVL